MIKGIIVVSEFWTRLFSWGRADAITLFPFIFLRKKEFKEDKVLINHERIHLQQAVELLVILFYLIYVLEFLYAFIFYFDFNKAYRCISFEREAYTYQGNLTYLNKRKLWSFWKFVKNSKNKA